MKMIAGHCLLTKSCLITSLFSHIKKFGTMFKSMKNTGSEPAYLLYQFQYNHFKLFIIESWTKAIKTKKNILPKPLLLYLIYLTS
jgi:hypothetical protein